MKIPKVKIRVSTCTHDWYVEIGDDVEIVSPGDEFQERLVVAGKRLKTRWLAAKNAKAQLNK